MLNLHAVTEKLKDLLATLQAYKDLQAKDKKRITKSDKRRIQEFEVILESILEPREHSDFIFDLESIALFFGVTARTVNLWVKQNGCPKIRHGLYDLKAVHTWWLDTMASRMDSREVENVKHKYWKYKAERERIAVEQIKGELIDKASVVASWSARLADVRNYLVNQQPSRIATTCAQKKEHEILDIVYRDNCRELESFARTSNYTPKVTDEK